jgi:hypothetical protein
MNTPAVMCGSTVHCMALTRVNLLLVVYDFRPSAGRGPGGDRPRPEQPQLISLLEHGLLGAGMQLDAARNISGYHPTPRLQVPARRHTMKTDTLTQDDSQSKEPL